MVAVVVPSPAVSFVLEAAWRAARRPRRRIAYDA